MPHHFLRSDPLVTGTRPGDGTLKAEHGDPGLAPSTPVLLQAGHEGAEKNSDPVAQRGEVWWELPGWKQDQGILGQRTFPGPGASKVPPAMAGLALGASIPGAEQVP